MHMNNKNLSPLNLLVNFEEYDLSIFTCDFCKFSGKRFMIFFFVLGNSQTIGTIGA